ncbi:apolipoprotein N-acyltransferase [Planctomycetes bacterium MalM25]|nr:apolipoprotein N-acyltransferase [Planctomycetes bacterium MalM25]
MPTFRIALANLRPGVDRDEALLLIQEAVLRASGTGAQIVVFPEGYVPGYRAGGAVEPFDPDWLDEAWQRIDQAAMESEIGVVLGTERRVDKGLRLTARVTRPNGVLAGYQDKVQLDPSEESTYEPGHGRRLFEIGGLRFGIVICHEGWRYPETVRWAARAGAQVVFHPHFEITEAGASTPARFADPANTFHEKAMLCRAAENTIYFASCNAALPGGTTTSAVIDPEGRLVAHQPYGEHGLLVVDLDLERATGLLADRLRPDGLTRSTTA